MGLCVSVARRVSLLQWVVPFVLFGCPPPRPDGDAGDVRDPQDARDATVRSDVIDSGVDLSDRAVPNGQADCGLPFLPDAFGGVLTPTMNECCPEPNAHVDCFGGGACRGTDQVVSTRFAPVYTCSEARAREYFASGVCEQLGAVAGRCPPTTRCDPTAVGPLGLERNDPRYPACISNEPFAPFRNAGSGRLFQFWRLACSDGGPSIGSACRGDQDCRPAPASVRGRLACVSGACAEQPRPAPVANFGDPCTASARPLGSASNCAACATPVDGCGSTCTMECLFDEDCPDSFVCAYSSDICGGACVPEGRRGALGRPVASGDGGTSATDASAPSCVDGGGDL